MNNAPVSMQRNPSVQGLNSQGQVNNAQGQMYQQGPKPGFPGAPQQQYGLPPQPSYGGAPPAGAPPQFNANSQFNMAPPYGSQPPPPQSYNSAPPYASAPPAYGSQQPYASQPPPYASQPQQPYGSQPAYGNPPLQNFQTQRPNIPPGAQGYVGSVSLQKGGNMSLSKANPNLVKVRIGNTSLVVNF